VLAFNSLSLAKVASFLNWFFGESETNVIIKLYFGFSSVFNFNFGESLR